MRKCWRRSRVGWRDGGWQNPLGRYRAPFPLGPADLHIVKGDLRRSVALPGYVLAAATIGGPDKRGLRPSDAVCLTGQDLFFWIVAEQNKTMRKLILTYAFCFGLSNAASAELIARLNFGGKDVDVLVLCSQHSEFNADRLRKFLRDATGIAHEFSILDGPVQFLPPDEDTEPASKVIVVLADGEPDQTLKQCVDETVSFGAAVFDNIGKARAALGKPPDLPTLAPEILQYGTVKFSASIEEVADTEWTIYAAASALPTPSAVNDVMTGLFGLDPGACSQNDFCLPYEN